MIKVQKTVFGLFIIALLGSLTGCQETRHDAFAIFTSEPEYEASTGFFFSSDKGHSYSNGVKEYVIGETVYMRVQFKVSSNKKKVSQVRVVLSIPNVDNVDAKYMDGQVITPNYDPLNNVTTYEFIANASKNAPESFCVIQFIPNSVGSVTMKMEYDDNLDSSYDIQSSLEFVNASDTVEE